MKSKSSIPNVLSIAGSDPSGGAGIQADLKTFAALGCYGMAAVTALTAQNTRGVSGVHLPPAAFVADQIHALFDDVDIAAVKIGMIGSAEIAAAVAAALQPHRIPIVLDPVLVATSGAVLGDDGVVSAILDQLVPLATLVTPNLMEAARLVAAATGTPAPDLGSAPGVEAAARALRGPGPSAWLIKGGHRDTSTADDFLLSPSGELWLSSPRASTANTHGTGCTLSAAIAARLAFGDALPQAVRGAKDYLDDALAGADRLAVGAGAGPLDHSARRR